MANSILTPTAVTREILRILHEKLSFLGTVNRTYDDSYAKEGAKIGDTLKIRLPNEYTVRTGKNLNAQDTTESSVDLVVATQKGVDINFSSAELTMEMQDFSKRVLEPAIARLASDIEYTALLDNFSWGNTHHPDRLGDLVRATQGCYEAASKFGTPFISDLFDLRERLVINIGLRKDLENHLLYDRVL